MTEIVLIRHGETAWNVARRLQGHIDIALNDAGVVQANALGRALAAEHFDAIYASDLKRARQTALAVANTRAQTVVIDPALRERCYGGFEGLTHAEVVTRFPEYHKAWQARVFDAPLPAGESEGETLRSFNTRVLTALANIAKRHAGGKVAVVTHGGVLECAHRAAQGLTPDRPRDFPILNASINRLSWDGARFELMQWANVAHLEEAAEVALDEVDR